MPEKEVPQPAETTADNPAATPQSNPNPTPNPEPTQEPIAEAKKPSRGSLWLVAGALAVLVLTVAAYAYSQGYFSGLGPTTASPQTASTTPTVSDDITAVDTTATEVNSDLNDINAAFNELDNLDTSNDEAPAL